MYFINSLWESILLKQLAAVFIYFDLLSDLYIYHIPAFEPYLFEPNTLNNIIISLTTIWRFLFSYTNQKSFDIFFLLHLHRTSLILSQSLIKISAIIIPFHQRALRRKRKFSKKKFPFIFRLSPIYTQLRSQGNLTHPFVLHFAGEATLDGGPRKLLLKHRCELEMWCSVGFNLAQEAVVDAAHCRSLVLRLATETAEPVHQRDDLLTVGLHLVAQGLREVPDCKQKKMMGCLLVPNF